jgi:hypothetical protein
MPWRRGQRFQKEDHFLLQAQFGLAFAYALIITNTTEPNHPTGCLYA